MRDILLTALAPITWGTTYFVTTQLLPPNRPLFVSVMRALPIGFVILAIFPQRPKGIWYWRAAVLGALNIGLFFALLFIAAYRLPGGVIATTNATQPFIVATLAWACLGEKLTTSLIAAACAGLVGVALIVLSPAARLDFMGVIAAAAATITWAGVIPASTISSISSCGPQGRLPSVPSTMRTPAAFSFARLRA